MIIRVTQDDVDEGNRSFPSSCPVARAIQRETGKMVLIPGTGWRYVESITPDETDEEFAASFHLLPTWVTSRIKEFDEGGSMEPFEFEIDD